MNPHPVTGDSLRTLSGESSSASNEASAESATAMVSPRRMANAIRALSIDAVQQANSGHPGAPMGMAEMAVALWTRHLKFNPASPHWFDRDRFVLSNGHASMLLYSVLHLTGYDLPIEELRRFRQLHSRTPGHPEVDLTPGVETTTGPLGQGLANAVGMALAERWMAGQFNRDGHSIIDHLTYAFVGDGCLMEGISHEACSLAGALELSRLIVLYDSNGISIDGPVGPWFGDDAKRRFEAYRWNVIDAVDGQDVDAVDRAIGQASDWARNGRDGRFAPTLIVCRTEIGHGSPGRAGTAKAHGEALGEAEIAATRDALDWHFPPFEIPPEIQAAWDARERGARAEQQWQQAFEAYRQAHPVLAAELQRRIGGELPDDWDERLDLLIEQIQIKNERIATRKASQNALSAIAPVLPELLGGSADLTGSNLTEFAGSRPLLCDGQGGLSGNHIHYGVREFGMSAAMNGMALHGGVIPYGGTFLTFSDYARNAVRMAALMKRRVVFVYTHDSIGLGEDGPTHQSVEHAAALRLIPNLDLWRPADGVESAIAWGGAIRRTDGPSALLFSRQAVDAISRSQPQIEAISRGGYVLRDAGTLHAVILATGSEVGLALSARELLAEQGIEVRVVSLPSTSVFDRQDVTYKRNVLPDNVPRIAVEAGVTDFWWKYRCDAVVGLDRYGESAPAGALFKLFGFTPENVADTVREVLRRAAIRDGR